MTTREATLLYTIRNLTLLIVFSLLASSASSSLSFSSSSSPVAALSVVTPGSASLRGTDGGFLPVDMLDLVKKESSPAILPYFGGTEGEACRLLALEGWKERADTTLKTELDAVMNTDLYKKAQAHCKPEIELYNRASAVVCLLQRTTDYPIGYNEFWMGGAYFYDGNYDLATMFSQTSNFTKTGAITPCCADCYLGGGGGCQELKEMGFLKYYGEISVAQYCGMNFASIDQGYSAIKLCAAEAIGQPMELSREAFVGVFQSQVSTNLICTYKYCNPDVYSAIKEDVCA